MLDPALLSKLSLDQQNEISHLATRIPESDVIELARLVAEEVYDRSLNVRALLKAVELVGPLAVDHGKRIWHYNNGVWLSDGIDEVTNRISWIMDKRYKRDNVAQVASLTNAWKPKIEGSGPSHLINVRNGMLNWKTGELESHDANYFSTVQLLVSWNPDATCPTIDAWLEESIDKSIHDLLWQVAGVVWHPGMGFQKIILLLGDGYNGKGTFLRLCQAALPRSATCSVDPKLLAGNRFASAEMFGKTANIVGDIYGGELYDTSNIKKITGDDVIHAERKMGHPFNFLSECTNLWAGNKFPESKDESLGWKRRWFIIPFTKEIQGKPNPDLEPRMHLELEGALVKAVNGLRIAMEAGDFVSKSIPENDVEFYEKVLRSEILFFNEKLDFADSYETPIANIELMKSYEIFCRSRGLKAVSRTAFYKSLEKHGTPHVQVRWISSDEYRGRGYIGLAFKVPPV
jgi:putative DNA primase/helicase